MNKEDFIILTDQGCNAYGLESITYEIAVNKNNIETIRTINDNTYIHLVSGHEIRVNECIDKILEFIKEGETTEE